MKSFAKVIQLVATPGLEPEFSNSQFKAVSATPLSLCLSLPTNLPFKLRKRESRGVFLKI